MANELLESFSGTGELEYVEPDPRLRRMTIAALVVMTAVGAATIGWFLPWASRALMTARATGALTFPLACYLFLGYVALLALPVVWYGVYAVRFGRRVLASGRYPPPGTRVIRRTPVIRGRIASFTARGQIVLGGALVLCGLVLFGLAAYGLIVIAT